MGELNRIHLEYEDRKRRLSGSDIYSAFNQSYLFMLQGRQRAVLSALKRNGFLGLPKLKILEMGCGGGGVLAEYLAFGVPSSNLYGVDLLPDRLTYANNWLPGCSFSNADGQYLPFAPQSFDLVMQYTAISSILDADIRRNICEDMMRVVKYDESS
jgi:ubiquinone/menaquinone biosynthesis C-methylase UbiE